jgi:transposase
VWSAATRRIGKNPEHRKQDIWIFSFSWGKIFGNITYTRGFMAIKESNTVVSNSLPSSGQIHKRKLLLAERSQYGMEFSCLDAMIDEEHRVRNVWKFIELMNIDKAMEKIQSFQNSSGRPAIDPKILLTLWLYATIEGYGSAYQLEKLCHESLPYKWICGGVEIGRKTLSDFRVNCGEILDSILINGITALIQAEVVDLEEISQDGLKVRVAASEKSYRTKKSIEEMQQVVRDHVIALKKEIEENPLEATERRKKMRLNRIKEKEKRVEEALQEVENLIAEKNASRAKDRKKKLTKDEEEKVKISVTEPKSRLMKMPSGGYKLAMNCEFAMDTKSRFIIGVKATNQVNDSGQIGAMFGFVKDTYSRTPKRYLVDGGFRSNKDVQNLYEQGCEVYMPVPRNNQTMKEEHPEGVNMWKTRMQAEGSKKIYSRRASTIEWFNAGARKRGLQSFMVRSPDKAQIICNLHALAHNIERMRYLNII